jgi:hypothetical protein
MARLCSKDNCPKFATPPYLTCESHRQKNRAAQARSRQRIISTTVPTETKTNESSVRTTQTATNISQVKSQRVTEVRLPDGTVKRETNIQTQTNTTIWIQEVESKARHEVKRALVSVRQQIEQPKTSLLLHQLMTIHDESKVEQVLRDIRDFQVYYQVVEAEVQDAETFRQENVIEVKADDKRRRERLGLCPFLTAEETEQLKALYDDTPIDILDATRRNMGRDFGMLIVKNKLTKEWKLTPNRYFLEDISKDALFLQDFYPGQSPAYIEKQVAAINQGGRQTELHVECSVYQSSSRVTSLILPASVYAVYLRQSADASDQQMHLVNANAAIDDREQDPDFLAQFYPKNFNESKLFMEQFQNLYQTCMEKHWPEAVLGGSCCVFDQLEQFHNIWNDAKNSHELVRANFPPYKASQLLKYYKSWARVLKDPKHRQILREKAREPKIERNVDRVMDMRRQYEKDKAASLKRARDEFYGGEIV